MSAKPLLKEHDMGKHATQGTALVGHKSTTLKQGARHAANQRIYMAASLASEVTVEHFEPITGFDPSRPNPFQGINPVYGQAFTQTGPNTYKLRVKDEYGVDCYVGMIRITVKPQDGKAFGIWVASYAGRKVPLLTNKGQALGTADARDKLFAMLITGNTSIKAKGVTPGDRKPKAIKPYYGGAIEFATCQVTMEPMRVCDHCH
jgi:hypothetical protein